MKFTCYYKSDTSNPIVVNNPDTSSIYIELGFSKTHLVRLTRFYEQFPEHLDTLFNSENCSPLMSIESKAYLDNKIYKTFTTLYDCNLFNTNFLALIKKTPNKKTILLIIHPIDGFDDLEEKFNVFDDAKI